MRELDWKFKELITALGGPVGVNKLFTDLGFEAPPVETIKGWRLRNSIPGKYVPLLLATALLKGLIDNVAQLRKVRK